MTKYTGVCPGCEIWFDCDTEYMETCEFYDAEDRELASNPVFIAAMEELVRCIESTDFDISKVKTRTLEESLADVTEDNVHGEVDTGDVVGNEVW